MSELHKSIANCMPDCMMPDGAEPCNGYTHLLRKAEAQQDRIDELEEGRDYWQKRWVAENAAWAKEVDQCDTLKAMIHEAREVYAGMEGFEPETAPEGYCLRIIEQMYEALREKEDG